MNTFWHEESTVFHKKVHPIDALGHIIIDIPGSIRGFGSFSIKPSISGDNSLHDVDNLHTGFIKTKFNKQLLGIIDFKYFILKH